MSTVPSTSTELSASTVPSILTEPSTPVSAQSQDSRQLLDVSSTSPIPPLAPSTATEAPSTPAPRNPHVYRRSPAPVRPRRKGVRAVIRKQSTNFKELCLRKTASLKAMCTGRSPGLGRKTSTLRGMKTPETVDAARGRQRSPTTCPPHPAACSPRPAACSPRKSPSPTSSSNTTSNTSTSEASHPAIVDRGTTIRRPSPPVWRPSLPPLDLVAEFDVADWERAAWGLPLKTD